MRGKRLNKIVSRKPKHSRTYFIKHKKINLTTKDLKKVGHKMICVCCGTDKQLTFDHIIPKALGGDDKVENGQILCFDCNLHKGSRLITIEDLKTEIAVAEKLKE